MDSDQNSEGDIRADLGRFDRSFFVRMTGTFLLLLVVVGVLELGLRFGLELWSFHRNGPDRVEATARQLAADVQDIMINEGGPVASRTVYPILDRAYDRAGLKIAVEPSAVTIESIQRSYGFRPRGIPAAFPEGVHNEARVELRAESLCVECHVTASEGDVLGTVVVRSYRRATLAGWWDGVRLSATVNAVKIVVHIAILFVLLRVLMAPLMSLRGAVARLADGTGGIGVRAQVRTDDEFGELAHDLNAFLDRISEILDDLRRMLSRTVDVSRGLQEVGEGTWESVARVEEALASALPDEEASDDEIRRSLQALPALVHEVHLLREAAGRLGHLNGDLERAVATGDRLLGRLRVPDESDGGGEREAASG